ncbi:MAG TPA: ribbon-helix-helix domain-containing protein [Candidatus Paceibacterota bacterium]
MGTPVSSLVIKQSIIIDGHQTSVTLEDEFWDGFCTIAHLQNATLASKRRL